MDNKLTRYVLKNNEKRNNNLKYDFMPSLLEIIERPSHIAGTVVVVSTVILLITAILWASFSKLDVVVNGSGNVVPDGSLIDIHPLTGGIVENINVQVGDFVKTGDIIFSIQNETAELDLEQLEYNIEWCKIRREIVEERLKNDEYEILVEKYDEKFSNGLKQMILENDMSREQKIRYQKDMDEESINENMKLQKSQMYSQLFSLDHEMNGYEIQLKKHKISSEKDLVKSPVNGYVNMITVVSEGQVVSAGNPVASIVPADSPLIVECYVPDKDRDELSIGLEANIKLAAFPFSDYGDVKGKITYISPSAFNNEKLGNVYVVKIKINHEGLNPNIELTSGLSGNVEIVIGRRTVMQYFLDPIMGTLRDSLKEN